MKDKIEKTTLEEVVVKEETTPQEEKQKIEILKSFKDLGQVFEVKQKIEITKKALENNIDAFVHNYNVNNSFFEKYNDCGFVDGHFTNSESCTNIVHSLDFPVHHSHIAVKRYCLEKVRFNESEKFYRSEDGKFCQDLISSGFDIGYSSHKLVNYRTR